MIQYAYGDIHGMYDTFVDLRAAVHSYHQEHYDDAEFNEILLGDYVDRGMQSKKVLEYIIEHDDEFIVLPGNHEELMYDFFASQTFPDILRYGSFWARNGGTTTMCSFFDEHEKHPSFEQDNWYDLSQVIDWKNHVEQNFPHILEYLRKIRGVGFLNKVWHIEDRVLFVHAGIHPFLPFKDHEREDLLWGRNKTFLMDECPDKWIDQKDFDLVVHGHTISSNVAVGPRRIGVDTGAYSTGTLSVAVIEDGNFVGSLSAHGTPSIYEYKGRKQ
tara:strand:+ start:1241 stop:2056 length:816 start_codon:yes stop_codon:yes gene_type:complete